MERERASERTVVSRRIQSHPLIRSERAGRKVAIEINSYCRAIRLSYIGITHVRSLASLKGTRLHFERVSERALCTAVCRVRSPLTVSRARRHATLV